MKCINQRFMNLYLINLLFLFSMEQNKFNMTASDENETELYDKNIDLDSKKVLCNSTYMNNSNNPNVEEIQIKFDKINEIYRSLSNGEEILWGPDEIDDVNLTNTNESGKITNNKLSQYEIINQDGYLKPFEYHIKKRMDTYKALLSKIEKNEGSLIDFSQGYKKLGLNVIESGITYKEYAPGAKSLSICGDFNYWNREEFHCSKDVYGFWSITLPRRSDGELPIKHNTRIKVHLTLANGRKEDRNPVWSTFLVQDKQTLLYDSIFWNPSEKYQWKHESYFKRPKTMRIYEAHVGMSSAEYKISTYREFADQVLPRIKNTGYTAVQLMAIMEHAYYGSFGYHVTNFFAISQRFGTPDDIKYLIDKAHQMGLFVIMDIVHSHASTNVLDGFNLFDGTDYLYFHGGPKGLHTLWDSRVFNYKNWETLRFLLSNCAWYIEEYHFDGYRFDGVTSMLYNHHGINYEFSGNYNEYFNDNVDLDACVYLMLANHLIKSINPNAVTIAEDVSGMPSLCLPIQDGGFGFDYRLNMAVPDKWIQMLKEFKDEQWNMGNLCFTLTNRRHLEKHIGYSESHDQSIVGDKTIAMWLFDKEIYYDMSLFKPATIVVDRGMALHKMIRLLTFSLAGEAYLNFMGNEFGHPEWVDFPRPGNNFSFNYCRRQWNLCDDENLRYKFLLNFDRSMNNLDNTFEILNTKSQYLTLAHESDKLIVYEKGDLLFVFNFHHSQSFEHYRIGTKWESEHLIVLDTDETRFHGKNRLTYGHNNFFPIIRDGWMNRRNYIQLYIPSRTAIVLIAKENIHKYKYQKGTEI